MIGGGHTEDFTQNLKDAGCDANKISDICRLYHAGQVQNVMKALRRHRCSLLDELHENQRKIDCLDFLIYQIQKS